MRGCIALLSVHVVLQNNAADEVLRDGDVTKAAHDAHGRRLRAAFFLRTVDLFVRGDESGGSFMKRMSFASWVARAMPYN
jgi:hypothetical protein